MIGFEIITHDLEIHEQRVRCDVIRAQRLAIEICRVVRLDLEITVVDQQVAGDFPVAEG